MGWTMTEHRKFHHAHSKGGKRDAKELSMEKKKVKVGWEKTWQRERKASSKHLQSERIEGEESFTMG